MVGKRVRDAVRALVIRDSLRGQPVSDIAEWTGKHKSTVYRIKNQYDASGYSSAPKHSNLGRPGKIEDGIGMHIQILYSNTPTLYHDEAADCINELLATDLNQLDVFRYLRKIGWTRKRLSVRAAQRNSTLRSHHSIQFADYTIDQLVFLDETAVDNRSAYRKFGYAPHGSPACEDRGRRRGLRWSLLPAFSQEGMICHSVYQGSFDANRFVDFVADKLLNVLKPFPAKHSVVVMDKCGTHHDPRVRELIIDHGCRIEYLPPYSPDLNPIEIPFSMLKSWIKRNREHPWAMEQPGYFLSKELDLSINAYPEKRCNLMRECGYGLAQTEASTWGNIGVNET